MSTSPSTTARGTSVLMFQSIISGALRILNIAILARLVLQDEMGQIAILGVIYGFMQFLGALGLNYAAPLVVPEKEESGNLDMVKSFLYRSIVLIVFSSTVMIILVLLLSPFIIGFSGISIELVQLVVIIVPFSALEVFLDSFLLARYTVRKLAAGRSIFDLVRVSSTIILVIAGLSVGGVMIGWLLGELAAVFIFGSIAIHGLDVSSKAIDMRPILAFALPSLLFQFIDVTIQNFDRVILLYLTDLSALGVYDVLLRILFMFSLVSLTLSVSLYPILTRTRVQSERGSSKEQLGRVTGKILRYILILLLPVATIAAFNSSIILEIMFGPSYAMFPNASSAFSILLLSYVLWGLVYALHSVLRSLGESRFFLISGLVVIAFETIGCWYLISWLGLLGAALIRSMYILLLLFMSLGRLYQTGYWLPCSLMKSAIRIMFASIMCALLVFLLAPTTFLTLVLVIIIALGLYLFLLFCIKEVDQFDFVIAYSIFPQKLLGLLKRFEQFYFRGKDKHE